MQRGKKLGVDAVYGHLPQDPSEKPQKKETKRSTLL